jgi:hypothetical protein
MNVKTKFEIFLILFIYIFTITSCAALLPSSGVIVKSPWPSFQDAKLAFFDKIISGETRIADLKKNGFDPETTPNVDRLNHLDIRNLFLGSGGVKIEDLDPKVRYCLAQTNRCFAYEIKLRHTTKKREGNFFLDFLRFKKKTKMTGWQLQILLLVVNDVIEYKLWKGTPNIDTKSEDKKPLGFLQEADDITKALTY